MGLDKYTVQQLRDWCYISGIDGDGTKSELIERIKNYISQVLACEGQDMDVDQIGDVNRINDISFLKLVKPLGKGAYGEVNLMEDSRDGVQYAVKKVNGENFDLIKTELSVLNKLKKEGCMPNILCFKEVFQYRNDEKFYILTEFIQGSNLGDFIYTNPSYFTINKEAYTKAFQQLIKTLDVVHKLDISHSDIKPENLMITPDGDIRLIDFGMACDTDIKCGIGGTVVYMPPELMANMSAKKKISLEMSKSYDIYASGMTLALMINPNVFDDWFAKKLTAQDLYNLKMEGADLKSIGKISSKLQKVLSAMIQPSPQRPTTQQIIQFLQ